MSWSTTLRTLSSPRTGSTTTNTNFPSLTWTRTESHLTIATTSTGRIFRNSTPNTSFPVPPTFLNEEDRKIKVPDWLNDPTVYHNRGEASTGGESAQYGDISGLDDLFTEQPRVVRGMIDIYANWIKDFDITGFRLDTVKHVNNEFWQSFIPAIQEAAQTSGRKDFFIFGEVYDFDPAFLSEFAHRASMPSVLDFGFQQSGAGIRVG